MIERYPLSTEAIDQLRQGLLAIEHALKPDVSNYAPERLRTWLQWEWRLKERDFVSAIALPNDTWQLCRELCFRAAGFYPDLGLAAKGKQGIRLHRDDSFAAFKAVSIQLGKAEWSYNCQYPGYDLGGSGAALTSSDSDLCSRA